MVTNKHYLSLMFTCLLAVIILFIVSGRDVDTPSNQENVSIITNDEELAVAQIESDSLDASTFSFDSQVQKMDDEIKKSNTVVTEMNTSSHQAMMPDEYDKEEVEFKNRFGHRGKKLNTLPSVPAPDANSSEVVFDVKYNTSIVEDFDAAPKTEDLADFELIEHAKDGEKHTLQYPEDGTVPPIYESENNIYPDPAPETLKTI